MSEQCQVHKETRMFVKLVDHADWQAAHASAEVLAKFGIALMVFTDREMMNHWLAGVRKISGLSVRILRNQEVANV